MSLNTTEGCLVCECCGVSFSTLGRRMKNGAISCPVPSSTMHPKYCSAKCRQSIQNSNYAASLKADPAKRAKHNQVTKIASRKPSRVAAKRTYAAATKDQQKARNARFWRNPAKAELSLEKQRLYRQANRKEISQRDVEYRKQRKQSDPAFRVVTNLRNRVYSAVMAARKGKKTVSGVELLGCTPQQLVEHLEAQFLSGMTWDNYGLHGWHVDHIKPVAAFKDPEDPACWHFTNYQPLWAEDNWAKSDSWTA